MQLTQINCAIWSIKLIGTIKTNEFHYKNDI